MSVTYVIVFGEESTTVPKCMGGFVVSPYTQRHSILALGVFGFCNCDDLVVSQKYRGMLGTEIENISLDFCCNKKATRAADIGRNYVGLYCKNFRQKLGRLPLPLEGYLDNTYFRTTNEGLPHPEYFLIKGFLPKAPTKELGAGPYSTLKIPVCSRGSRSALERHIP